MTAIAKIFFKKISFLLLLVFVLTVCPFSVSSSRAVDDPSTAQVKQEYRAYLQELKELSKQYQQITGQMKQVIAEEGLPVWDENSGGITLQHDVDFSGPSAPVSAAGPGVQIQQTDKEMTVDIEAPGLKKDTIRVSILDNKVLKIAAHKKVSGQSLERVIELPVLVKDNGTEARYEDGVLSVKILKAETAKKEVSVPVR